MTNEITINPLEIIKLPDNSITDNETIRQIALWSIKFNDNSLNSKIKHELQFAGLYPHVHRQLDLHPEKVDYQSIDLDSLVEKIQINRKSNREQFVKGPSDEIVSAEKLTSMEPRTSIMNFEENVQENYQNPCFDKYEIMLSANAKSIYPVGHLHKFTNEIFNKNTGIAFFQIDKEWDVLWTRKFTGFFDKNKEEIYAGDYLEDDNNIYEVQWNRNQAQWWLEPVVSKAFEKVRNDVKDVFLEYVCSMQSLGNGYFKRDDLVKIGNKFENPEIVKTDEKN